ncbi:MAG: hypothetical protein Q9M92_09335 [Enterobacterales bacterium]|nr:hypothetical protein [Enterobacterales bacterium]
MKSSALKKPFNAIDRLLGDLLKDDLIETLDFSSFDFAETGIPMAPLSPPSPAASSSPQVPALPQSSASTAPTSTPRLKNQVDSDSSPSKSGNVSRNQSKHSVKTSIERRSLGKKALAVARKEIGVKEIPKGSNRGPRVDQYQNAKGYGLVRNILYLGVSSNPAEARLVIRAGLKAYDVGQSQKMYIHHQRARYHKPVIFSPWQDMIKRVN